MVLLCFKVSNAEDTLTLRATSQDNCRKCLTVIFIVTMVPREIEMIELHEGQLI